MLIIKVYILFVLLLILFGFKNLYQNTCSKFKFSSILIQNITKKKYISHFLLIKILIKINMPFHRTFSHLFSSKHVVTLTT